MRQESLFEFEDVWFSYNRGIDVLKGCNLEIREGMISAIIGPNGCGKTTMLLHLNGILRPQKGHIKFKGSNITYEKDKLRTLRSRIGIVFQNPDTQLFSTSVIEDVSFGVMNMGLSKSEAEERVITALELVGMLNYKEKPIHMLSFGQKKRVAIAGIIAMNPEVLVFDEPFAGLDHFMIDELINLMDRLKRNGHSVILATHDIDLAYQFVDEVVFLKDGKVLYQNSWENLQYDDWLKYYGKVPLMLEFSKIIHDAKLIRSFDKPRNLEDLRRKLLYNFQGELFEKSSPWRTPQKL